MFNYKGYKIFWHDHNNQVRDYLQNNVVLMLVCDTDTGECLHYTSVDNLDFNLANRKKG